VALISTIGTAVRDEINVPSALLRENVSGRTANLSEEKSAASTKNSKIKSKKKSTRLAKKRASKKIFARKGKPRKPASIVVPKIEAPVLTQTFDEKTGFESMVQKRAEMERNPAAFEPSARVIGIRREMAMTSEEDGKIPQDILLSGGAETGLSEGMILSVVRKIPVIDPFRENYQTELEVKFGTVRIVQAQKDVAVARIESIFPASEAPGIGTRAIMVGDWIGKAR